MVSTIGPLVQVAKLTWTRSIVAFVAASTVAGAAFGACLGALGSTLVPAGATALILALFALLFALIEAGAIPVEMPFWARSVPKSWWIRLGPTRAAVAYGAALGIGVTTVIPFASFYFVLVAAALSGPVYGAVILGLYGLGRALPVVIASLAFLAGAPVATIATWPINKRRVARTMCAVALVVTGAGLLATTLLEPGRGLMAGV